MARLLQLFPLREADRERAGEGVTGAGRVDADDGEARQPDFAVSPHEHVAMLAGLHRRRPRASSQEIPCRGPR